jgi:replicative DNA helicase
MAFLRRKNQTPDPVLSAIDDLMSFSAQALEVSREEARVSSERLAMLEELVAKYGAALEAEKAANSATADRLNLIEQRLVSMGNELSHQLHEMGNEIDRLGQNTGDGASAEILDALRSTQTKLAQEQARYEIAFRQDLAALADQLRRSR